MGVSWSLLCVHYQNFPIFYIHCQLKKDMCLSKLNSAIRRPFLHFDNAFISKAKAGSEWVPCPLERVKTIIHHLRVFDVGAMMLTFGREIAQWGRNRIFSKISLPTKSESITFSWPVVLVVILPQGSFWLAAIFMWRKGQRTNDSLACQWQFEPYKWRKV